MFRIWTLLSITLLCGQIFTFDNDEMDEDAMHPSFPPDEDFNNRLNSDELKSEYWILQARAKINEKIKQKLNTKKAKNIIMFLGDGMSVHTITATRTFVEDVANQISFEKFPYFGLSKTYCVDSQVADSACSATAYLCGVKGNYATIGVNGKVQYSHCEHGKNVTNHVDSIAKWAQDSNKATGIVTTTRITHASPAGVYAHIVNRDWECDSEIDKECIEFGNADIAQQLVDGKVGQNFKVILGGGRSMFRDKKVNDEEGYPGKRSDGQDLIKNWLKIKNDDKASYIWNRKQLIETDFQNTNYLLGLFSPSHCPFNGDRIRDGLEKSDPSLSEMTESALKILQKEKNGYFLFVEGGRIDHAHHYTQARKALEDTVEFAKAIQLARNMTSEEDTLIVVTSDHSHTMTINGYPKRNTNILGLSGSKGTDDLPYTTLSYANGPGHYKAFPQNTNGGRHDMTHDNFENPQYEYPGSVPLKDETHGGEDVGVFASGPQAHLFVGNYEQSYIPNIMAAIAEIGPFRTKANTKRNLRKNFQLSSLNEEKEKFKL